MVTVLVKGATNSRTVKGWGHRGHTYEIVQPVVVRTDTGVGVGLALHRKGNAAPIIQLWEDPSRIDPISCWRAMKLLEFLQHIDASNLEDAYYAARRHQRREHADKADRVIGPIHMMSPLGTHIYYEIVLKWQIPSEIVDLVIQLWDEGVRCDPESIADEISAGTLAWRDEFLQMGLQKPERRRTRPLDSWLCGY